MAKTTRVGGTNSSLLNYMAKVKLTKGELKRHRDTLRQYQRYLPTLQLKKQQLQIEILRLLVLLEEKSRAEESKRLACLAWSGLLATDSVINLSDYIKPKEVVVNSRNIAGIDLPFFERMDFPAADYDLFLVPLWVDAAIEALRALVMLRKEMEIIRQGISILRHELRITAQRVNLFEKVKIPEATEAIRLIKIYIGDQMTNAVGRSKIAKKKIELAALQEVCA